MKFLDKNYKKNFVRMKVENLDDLWYLTYVLEKSDTLKALTYRKIKLGGDEEDKKIIKKPVVLPITIEKVEFSKFSTSLRVAGTVLEGPEDIPVGSHHTITLEEGSEFSLEKKQFLKYQIDKLEEASQDKGGKILVVVHDREEAFFALLKKYGYEVLGSIKGHAEKKADVKQEKDDFFLTLKNAILEYDKRYNFSSIIIASPSFWKTYMQKLIKEKCVFATCSSVSINGINEVIRRPEVQEVLKRERFAEEMTKVETLFEEISKSGKAEYGLKQVKKAVENGSASELLITDSFIKKKRQEETFEEVENLMRSVENMGGNVLIISCEHEGGQKLDGLGGIGAILRYNPR
jgi:protein pelota